MKELGLIGESPYYIETVYRTNFTTAHTAGRWRSAQASKLVSMLKFVGVADDRQTDEICKPLNNTVKPKDDPIWQTIAPPNHFSCRSGIVELTKSYVAINGIKEKSPGAFEIPEDFATNPGESDAWMKPTKAMKTRLIDFEKANS